MINNKIISITFYLRRLAFFLPDGLAKLQAAASKFTVNIQQNNTPTSALLFTQILLSILVGCNVAHFNTLQSTF